MSQELVYSIVEESDISAELDGEIRELLVQCFPLDTEYYSKYSYWRSPCVWRILVRDNEGKLIGHIALTERKIKFMDSGDEKLAAGLQSVCVSNEWRGRGVSGKMMDMLMKEGIRRNEDAGLLFCGPKLVDVYANWGWKIIENEMFFVDGNGEFKQKAKTAIAMICPLKWDQWQDGPIDLQGRDW